jgi:tetraacyldisaccharide 4'-kinase
MKSFLSPIYATVTSARNFIYDVGFADTLKLNTPVVSIGNITVGGTGKTPVTQMLLRYYLDKGLKPAAVNRNYKAQVRSAVEVDPRHPHASRYYGDEPTLIALNNPEASVFVGPSKWQAAHLAETQVHPDVILIDDGFQHRALHRDLDLVLLDVAVPRAHYQMLPKGFAREPLSSLRRADFVLLTKTNFVGDDELKRFKTLLPDGLKTLEVEYHLSAPTADAGLKAVAFSGLARPESFKQSIQQDTKYELLDYMIFPDHHTYTHRDLDRILSLKKELGADVLLMTEKDAVKISGLIENPDFFRTLSLQTHFSGPLEEFHAALDKVVHSRP